MRPSLAIIARLANSRRIPHNFRVTKISDELRDTALAFPAEADDDDSDVVLTAALVGESDELVGC
jgi:hypothetical protein